MLCDYTYITWCQRMNWPLENLGFKNTLCYSHLPFRQKLREWAAGKGTCKKSQVRKMIWRKICHTSKRKGVVLPSRGVLTGWRNRLSGTSCSSTTASAKSCTWGIIIPHTSTCWGQTSLKAALQERTPGPWWTASWTWASNKPLQAKKVNSVLGFVSGSIASRSREVCVQKAQSPWLSEVYFYLKSRHTCEGGWRPRSRFLKQ